jgi:hypothetical protein
MYFCPNCSYILDITKSSLILDQNQKIPLLKINELFKLLDNNEDISNYKPEFSKDDLFKHKKIKDYDKNKLNELFEDNILSNAEFICNNCNYTNQINKTTLLYQITLEDKTTKIYNIEENKLIINDPLLPHTRDYICKNQNCLTHKNSDIKDSVFYKDKNSYKVNYICSICFYNW